MIILAGIVGGFVALILGGELLVRGASNLAALARVSPLIIGLTVVAFGTSAPELAVSVGACYAGSTDLAVGNAVGSNISNMLLVLGFAALAAPLAVSARLFRIDIPVMIMASVLLWLVGRDGSIDHWEGVAFFAALVAYFSWTIWQGRRESAVVAAEEQLATSEITIDPKKAGVAALLINVGLVVVGLVLLVGGADFLVDACVALATKFGVSELVVGLTVVAIGTSLPELVTSLMASMRGQRDLAVGNVVGSNILNILCVLGLSAIVAPEGINVDPQSISFDIPVMVAVGVALTPAFFSGLSITRGEGAAMVVYYFAYLGYLIWHSQQQPATVTSAAESLLFLSPLVPFLFAVWYFSERGKRES